VDHAFSPILMRHEWVDQAPSPIMKPRDKKNLVIREAAPFRLFINLAVAPLPGPKVRASLRRLLFSSVVLSFVLLRRPYVPGVIK
jgi:hypothetical protein